MFWATAILLFVTWGLGLVTGYTGSGLIHILPMLSVAVVLVRLIDSRPFLKAASVDAKSSQDGAPNS